MSAAELTRRELTSKTVPAGFDVDNLPIPSDAGADDSASPQATPMGRMPCDALTGGVAFATTYVSPASVNKDSVLLHTTALYGMKWLGAELLASYPGDGAAQVLADVRQLGARCAKTNIGDVNTTTYATVVDGPKLGDESLMVKVRSTSTLGGSTVSVSSDSVFIRIGATLIVIDENGTPTPADGSAPQLAALAPAAVTAFNAAGNGH